MADRLSQRNVTKSIVAISLGSAMARRVEAAVPAFYKLCSTIPAAELGCATRIVQVRAFG